MKLKNKSTDADKIQWLVQNKHLWVKPTYIIAKHMQVAGMYSMNTSTNDMVNSISRLMSKIRSMSNASQRIDRSVSKL